MYRFTRFGSGAIRVQAAVASVILAFGLAVLPATAQAQTVDLADYFILTPESTWHYTGEGQPGSDAEDNFQWTVLSEGKDVGDGKMAAVMLTETDEPSDARNNSKDFWFMDPADETRTIYYCGSELAKSLSSLPAQEIILDEPAKFGGDGQNIGDVIRTSRDVTFDVDLPYVGAQTVEGTLDFDVTYDSIDDNVVTPLGVFNDCLHLTFAVTITPNAVSVDLPPIRESEVWLKEGVGVVKHDQNADPDDAQIQAIDGGTVNDEPVTADEPTTGTSPTATPTPDGGEPTNTPTPTDTPTTATETPTPTLTPTDTPTTATDTGTTGSKPTRKASRPGRNSLRASGSGSRNFL